MSEERCVQPLKRIRLALPGTASGRLFDGRDEVHFDVRIMAVETPPPREIIKAMADLTAHGHGCDCGCGCG